jgi:hypothetical protein
LLDIVLRGGDRQDASGAKEHDNAVVAALTSIVAHHCGQASGWSIEVACHRYDAD